MAALTAAVAIHGSAPQLHAQTAASTTTGATQAAPQDPAAATKPDDQKDGTKEHGLERVRIRVEGDEVHGRGAEKGASSRGFHPLLGVIVSGSGLSAGLDYQDLRPGWSPVGFDAAAEVSYLGFQLYRFQVGYLAHRDTTETLEAVDAKVTSLFSDHAVKSRGVAVYASARYLRYPSEVFFGVGPRARKVDRTDYLLLGGLADGVVQYQFSRRFGVSGRVGLLVPGLGGDSDEAIQARFAERTTPGLLDVPRFFTTGAAAVVDARDEPSDPTRGAFLGAALWVFDQVGGSEYTFVRVTGDARWYHPLFVSRGVIALRALASTERPSAGGEVPFYLQQTLGGNEILRGFAAYRFRDRALAAASAEYRVRVNRWFDVGPFVDVGSVAPAFEDLAFDHLKWSGGARAGLRYKGRMMFNVGWGHSREGDRLFLSVGNTF